MAANFTLIPWKVVASSSEVQQCYNAAGRNEKELPEPVRDGPEQQFRLYFRGLTDSQFMSLVAHYHSCCGGYDSFSWTSVPSYIDTDLDGNADGSNMTGRWVEDSMSEPVINANSVDVDVVFEKDVS